MGIHFAYFLYNGTYCSIRLCYSMYTVRYNQLHLCGRLVRFGIVFLKRKCIIALRYTVLTEYSLSG